ncbi:MAG: SUMF1/EgtB/PvdO family nonheme iron enzyme [Candidatus Riflebacteria bacterium]|nr:SUMF1/EgtB/PvdO family nonheme iron enzyme [Candidatus Riflebacteria bacterium]
MQCVILSGHFLNAPSLQIPFRQAFVIFALNSDLTRWEKCWKMSEANGDEVGSNRVYRGGKWNNNANNCRSAYRNRNNPTNRRNNLGFRLLSTFHAYDMPTLRSRMKGPIHQACVSHCETESDQKLCCW